jgi:pyruvate/2-oxoglutarate dehydrogenase complex dihydrolipoamide dehydrogenase (E3) component
VGRSTGCTVNPSLNNEYRFDVVAAPAPRRVAVVGGGPAGLKAAIVLAQRGHRVTLYEQGKLGGKLRVAARSPAKRDSAALLEHLLHRLSQTDVKVVESRATAELLREQDFEHILVASGAVPREPEWHIEGEMPSVHASTLESADALAGPVVVIGAGLTGCDTALWLAQQGRTDVTLIEAESGVLPHGEVFTDVMGMPALLAKAGVTVVLGAHVHAQDGDGVRVQSADGESRHIKAGSLVRAMGYTADTGLTRQLQQALPDVPVVAVGTARKGARLFDALHDAFFTALTL